LRETPALKTLLAACAGLAVALPAAAAPSVKSQRVHASRHFIMPDQPKAFADALDAFRAQP